MNAEKLKQLQAQVRIGGKVGVKYVLHCHVIMTYLLMFHYFIIKLLQIKLVIMRCVFMYVEVGEKS